MRTYFCSNYRHICLIISTVTVTAMLMGCGSTRTGQLTLTGPSPELRGAQDKVAQSTNTNVYLHGAGANANPPTLTLDATAPSGSTEKYSDSPGVNFNGGNPWKEVGTWNAPASLTNGTLTSLSTLHVWLGLKNSDDQGTNFDLRAEVIRDGSLLDSGETHLITGLTRNANQAKEVLVNLDSISPVNFNGSTDKMSLRILTRIGTNGSGGFGGGHSNATGLRLYFDSSARSARFGISQNAGPVAVANASPANGSAPLSVGFSATGSNDPDGALVCYEWDFGEGAGLQDFTSTAGSTSHVYDSPGTYTATLRVTDDSNATATDTTQILVSAGEWAHTFGGTGFDYFRSEVADATGNLFAIGSMYAPDYSSADVLVSKWDSGGSLLWQRTWGGAGFNSGFGCTTDGTNLYFTADGSVNSPGGMLVVKFDGSGNMLWQKYFGMESTNYFPSGIVYTADNDIVLSGYTGDSAISDLLIVKIDPDGNLVWAKQWGTPNFEAPLCVAERNGNITISGDHYVDATPDGDATRCMFIGRFDSTGAPQWVTTWHSSSGIAAGNALAVDSEGSSVVVGDLFDDTDFTFRGLIVRCDNSGGVTWSQARSGTGFDYEVGVALDVSGTAFVVGATATSLALQKFDAAGNVSAQQLWINPSDSTGYSSPVLLGGNLYIPGYAPNSTGTWRPFSATISAVSPSIGSLTGTETTPPGSMLNATGTVSTPSGTMDTGGGSEDALLIKHAAP